MNSVYTKEQKDFIIANFPDNGIDFCSKALNLSNNIIYYLVEKLKLRRIYKNPPNLQNPQQKMCCKCHAYKSLSDFNKCKTGVYGYHNHCRDCQKIIRHDWYLKNREQELIKSSEYKKTDKAKEAGKKHWNKLKHILGPKQNERRRQEPAKIKARIQRKNWSNIPQNRIAQNLRGRTRSALRAISKIASTENLLGCTFEELKNYLQSKFLPDMSWENYGDWHIDHIKPCSSFDLTQEAQQKECFHYTNLQPLWAIDNISKGAKIL